MKPAAVRILRMAALAVWLAVGAAYMATPAVQASESQKCSDVCDGCSGGSNCKWCARIGDAQCYDPKAAELELE